MPPAGGHSVAKEFVLNGDEPHRRAIFMIVRASWKMISGKIVPLESATGQFLAGAFSWAIR